MRVLQGREEALGPKHTLTLWAVNCLGALYVDQGKLGEAEKMFMRALQGYEETLGMEDIDRYISALNTMWGLGNLFQAQKELVLEEVGSIHTVQGYDLNYVGVIIGLDLRFDPDRRRLFIDRDSYFDKKGKKNELSAGPARTMTCCDSSRRFTPCS